MKGRPLALDSGAYHRGCVDLTISLGVDECVVPRWPIDGTYKSIVGWGCGKAPFPPNGIVGLFRVITLYFLSTLSVFKKNAHRLTP